VPVGSSCKLSTAAAEGEVDARFSDPAGAEARALCERGEYRESGQCGARHRLEGTSDAKDSVRSGAPGLAAMRSPLRELTERDYGNEEQADDQHPNDDLFSLHGGIELDFLRLREQDGCSEERHRARL